MILTLLSRLPAERIFPDFVTADPALESLQVAREAAAQPALELAAGELRRPVVGTRLSAIEERGRQREPALFGAKG